MAHAVLRTQPLRSNRRFGVAASCERSHCFLPIACVRRVTWSTAVSSSIKERGRLTTGALRANSKISGASIAAMLTAHDLGQRTTAAGLCDAVMHPKVVTHTDCKRQEEALQEARRGRHRSTSAPPSPHRTPPPGAYDQAPARQASEGVPERMRIFRAGLAGKLLVS